ncbi:DUF4942 domain-containing protein [Leptospira andrefontaineae]|uniref:DUF4942 domain-containing protein n=1 Tax=Leptospira andrefontaineae TaxID=2484976 RepID=A0A4R9GYL5_9LEPT|nr:DUF4942 domain-containing protein [Leptospira andrefontaineae]TGK36263.1 DUF4942 domain-containing protein [Leptospira andrefontaineae]
MNREVNIAKKLSIAGLIEARDQSIRNYQEMITAYKRAGAFHKQFASYALGLDIDRKHVWFDEKFDVSLNEEIRKSVDRNAWNYLGEKAGLFDLMDASAREEFEKQLTKDVPVFCESNVMATFDRLEQEKEIIFNRGVIKVFKELDRTYINNDSFRVGKLAIFQGNYMGRTGTKIKDIERILHILDGKSPPDHAHSVESKIRCFYLPSESAGIIAEDSYLRIYRYKNGNFHVTFKRMDLLDKVNRIISNAFGESNRMGDRTKSKRWKRSSPQG